MYVTNIGGRAGNQMFTYAFIRKLMKINGEGDIIFNFSKSLFSDDLEGFNILSYKTTDKDVILRYGSLLQIVIYLMYKLSLRCNRFRSISEYIKNHLSKYGIYVGSIYSYSSHIQMYPSVTRNNIIIGLLENPYYLDDIKDLLQQDFSPSHPIIDHNKELFEIITNSSSVCVTIRRGDYVGNSKYFLCDQSYFIRAINMIKSRVNNPVFIFFSDDIDWCRNNIHIDGECYYERGDDPIWEKMRLMYSCKHFILSNSSFSWWAQYLSRNKDKIVVSPSRWHPNPNWTSQLIQDNFVKLEVQ